MRTLAAAAAVMVGLAACGSGGSPGSNQQGRVWSRPAIAWERLADSPLSPRTGAVGVWTGEEVLVFGGEQTACPPMADCVPSEEPALQDGAAYNPATDTWRPISNALVPVHSAQTAVIGDLVYVWVHSSPDPQSWPMFMQYSIRNDSWMSLPQPATADRQGPHPSIRSMVFAPAGDHLVGYSTSDEQGEQPDWLYDTVAGWSELPDDPHTHAFDRTIVWSGDRLVLFDKGLVANPGSERPSLARAAALDLDTMEWETLPESETLAYGPWFAESGRLVDPTLGSADGGEVNNWGRHYAQGGILDSVASRWLSLPEAPSGADRSAGVVGGSTALYTGHTGVVLDLPSERWLPVPERDEPEGVYGQTIVAAGTDLFLFGGVDWPTMNQPRFSNAAWSWSPRPADRAFAGEPDGTQPDEGPQPDPGPVHLWLSARTVAPGTELAGFLVNDGDTPSPTFGVGTTVERWKDGEWEPHRFLRVCLDHWYCTGAVESLDGDHAVEDIGLSAGPHGIGGLERFSTKGLDEGTYRVVHQSEGSDSGDTEAFGIFVVQSDAPSSAPMKPPKEPAVSITPGLTGPQADTLLTLLPLIPPPPGRGQTSDDVAEAARKLDEFAALERWEDGAWVGVRDLSLSTTSHDPAPYIYRFAGLPPLDPGAYRLVRRTTDGSPPHTGNFWVAAPGDLAPGTH